MKKLLSIVILISYMCCACGISLSFHHCAGEFKYLTVNDDDHEQTCCKGKKKMSMPSDCCKSHKVKFSKTDDKAQSFYSFVKKNVTNDDMLVPAPAYTNAIAFAPQPKDRRILFRPPPDRPGSRPLYILHSVFRI